ncbi:hypothetical protein BDY17DRAFT_152003 [Neohortaea acidophila]|uniref:Uncharacterized protein n=1 Tax=Neohortaea acidophila TaxID=245834 RepID=A0A6A6PU77_9PEZI|nr:uncharacterized protein BDY17DRAFT_152003 [Neohortaea acidophila]KAF2483669.1 hypothetical protein BDY17DRAFT_152003 [Neohortaea acidophila]
MKSPSFCHPPRCRHFMSLKNRYTTRSEVLLVKMASKTRPSRASRPTAKAAAAAATTTTAATTTPAATRATTTTSANRTTAKRRKGGGVSVNASGRVSKARRRLPLLDNDKTPTASRAPSSQLLNQIEESIEDDFISIASSQPVVEQVDLTPIEREELVYSAVWQAIVSNIERGLTNTSQKGDDLLVLAKARTWATNKLNCTHKIVRTLAIASCGRELYRTDVEEQSDYDDLLERLCAWVGNSHTGPKIHLKLYLEREKEQ